MHLSDLLKPLMAVEEWLLEALHAIGLAWGVAIVALTVIVRLAILPITIRQVRSQRELRRHAPELARLRERHKGDPERLRRETAAYYHEHGVNPLGAIGPTLAQIPVFISLYYLMRTDVANGLFGHEGFLFIPDLTQKPQGAVLVTLVLLYLCSQLATSAVTTRNLSGGQRTFAIALPLLFVGVAARFPAGLLVYWITSSLWSLGQGLAVWRAMPAAVPDEPAPAVEPAPAPTAVAVRAGGGRRRKRRHGRR